MPLVKSDYKPVGLFRNGHFSTVYSGLFRRVEFSYDYRERLELPDGDFVDIDWVSGNTKNDKLIILLHGLEGSANRPYMLGMAAYFKQNGFDVAGLNFRGCSGEPNRNYGSYHSGHTEDLDFLINHILEKDCYHVITLAGFSLGGNVTLKYLGERSRLPKQIKVAMAVSVPCSLSGSCDELHKLKNRPYHDMFKKYLLQKLNEKYRQFPEHIRSEDILQIKTLKDFDNTYTSVAHGFINADDYYAKSSSLQYLGDIDIPTLILNARNDSFLSADCFPVEVAKHNNQLFLEIPDHGGHVGFFNRGNHYYNEIRAMRFIQELIS